MPCAAWPADRRSLSSLSLMTRHGRFFFVTLLLACGIGKALAVPGAVDHRSPELNARVFADLNGNGKFDATDRPLAGVWVSDAYRRARSGNDGRLSLPASEQASGPIFVVQPAGFAVPLREDGLPDFWRPEGARRWDIALSERPTALPYDVRVFGDPQPKSMTDLGYFERDIVADEQRLPRARVGLSLGDIVHSNLALLPAMARATAAMKTPWLTVSGNHDRNHDATRDEDSLASFSRVFGPDTFAWEEPGLAVVVLDNVIHQAGSGALAAYVGGLREAQFAFLADYLPTVSEDVLLVLAMHIPLFDTDPDSAADSFRDADRQRLFALLATRRNTLLLTSHTHVQQHRWHGVAAGFHGAEPLHEFNVGATCGGFWSGLKDARGIPDTRMADGTPNGFATLSVRQGGAYALRWHVAGAAEDPPFGLHLPRVLRRGAWPGVGVYANVWMGDAESRVEFRVGGGEWRPMRRVDRADPALLGINADDDRGEALRAFDRAPEAAVSSHLWRGALPTDGAVGEHVVEVRVFDRWRGELRQTARYRLIDALP